MAEQETTATAEQTATTAASTAATATATAETPQSFINSDGTFKDGWTDQYVPEDFRTLGVFKTFTDVKGAMKQLGNLEKLRGRQGKGVMPPDETATQTERDMFYEAIGRPKTAADYKMEVPKEVEQFIDKTALESAREAMHKLGITQSQAAGLLAWQADTVKRQATAAQDATEAAYAAGLEEMTKRWGAAAPERTAIVKKLLNDYMAPQDKDKIEDAINRNPYVADLLSNIGKKFMEGKSIATSGESIAMTPAEAKQKADELIAEQVNDPKMRSSNPAKWNRLNAEIRRLNEMAVTGR